MQKNWFYYTMALYCTQEKHYRFNAWKPKKNSHFLGKRNDKILYYDCSNYYFEIEQEDGSKKYGKSKEHRPNLIIQMGERACIVTQSIKKLKKEKKDWALNPQGFKRVSDDMPVDITQLPEDDNGLYYKGYSDFIFTQLSKTGIHDWKESI